MASQPSMIPRLSSSRSSTSSIEPPEPWPVEVGKSLLDAAEDGDRQRVQQLLKDGADVNFFDEHYTALHHAAGGGHMELVGYLMDKGADLHALTDEGGTALHVAASEGQVMMIRDLIWRGIKVNTPQKDQSTPLYSAVLAGQKDAALELLKRGADPNLAEKSWKRTPLHIAATDGQASIAETLLKFRAKPNAQDSTGASPLYEAVNISDMGVAEILLEHGADVHLRDEMTKRSPLQDAKTDEMKALLAKYADREPVYEIPEPPPSEVNTFKDSMEKLKGSKESLDMSDDASDSPKIARSTLPKDIKMNTKIPSPLGGKKHKGSPFSKIKFGSKDKLNTSKSKTLTPQGSPAPGKKSPRVSRIPLDYKQKIFTNVDLNKAGTDPLSLMTKARSVECLDQGPAAHESKIPRMGKGDVEMRGSKNPWGGKLDLSNRRSTSQYSTLPKDMKYTDMKDRLMVTKTLRGGAMKTGPIVPFLPSNFDSLPKAKVLPDPVAKLSKDDKSDSPTDSTPSSQESISDVTDNLLPTATVEDIKVDETTEVISEPVPVEKDTDINNHAYDENNSPTVSGQVVPMENIALVPLPDKDNTLENERNGLDQEQTVNNNTYQEKPVDVNEDKSFDIWQEDTSAKTEDKHQTKNKKSKSGTRRLLCCCFGV